MESIEFHKYTCHGDDFIIIDNWDGTITEKQLAPLSQKLALNNWGIGANGVIFINAGTDDVDFACRFFQKNGYEQDLSISGALCVAHLSANLNIAPTEMTFKTKLNTIEAIIKTNYVSLNIPEMNPPEGVALIEVDGLNLAYNRINTGSPQAVATLESFNSNLNNIAKEVMKHTSFNNEHVYLNYAKINSNNSFTIKSFNSSAANEIINNGNGILATAIILAKQNIIKEKTINYITKDDNEKIVIIFNSNDIIKDITIESNVKYLFNGNTEKALLI